MTFLFVLNFNSSIPFVVLMQNSPGMCEPRSLAPAFGWVMNNGLKPSFMAWDTGTRHSEVDISDITTTMCQKAKTYHDAVKLPEISFSSVYIMSTETSWKKFLMRHGPLIPIMRYGT